MPNSRNKCLSLQGISMFGVAWALAEGLESLPDGHAVKRESGANPEQTRCCEFCLRLSYIYECTTVILFVGAESSPDDDARKTKRCVVEAAPLLTGRW